MATLCRINRQIASGFARRLISTNVLFKKRSFKFHWLLRSAGIGCGVYLIGKIYCFRSLTTYAASKEVSEGRVVKTVTSHREERFNSFASIMVEGEPYMTPQDFLLSVMHESPRIRTSKKRLSLEEAHKIVKNTPAVRKGKPRLFHSLQDKGLISYTEYLFLLCVLTKPRSGFRIAFNMFDRDGNQRVDREEFHVCVRIICGLRNMRPTVADTSHLSRRHKHNALSQLSARILELLIAKPKSVESEQGDVVELPAPPEEAPEIVVPTTLMTHFFGRKGKDMLKFEDFQRFMDNLQMEVLELEFNEHSHGFNTITEEAFAKILLRYTSLSDKEHELYLERLRTRIPEGKGILFKDFHDFCLFLNNLDDFALAVKIYSWANQPVSEEEFKRAVQASTDKSIDDYVVHTVFCLFDIDGDGRLSDQEFLSVMKDRLHRGFKSPTSQSKQGLVQNFRQCMKEAAAQAN